MVAVSVPVYEQQLRQRRQTLETSQKEIMGFEPKIKRTQAELRTATPLRQVRVKSLVAERREAKVKALQKVGTEFETQRKLEAQFVPVKKEYQEYQAAVKQQREWEEAYKVATGKPVLYFGASKSVRRKARKITKGFRLQVEGLQAKLQKGEKLIVDKEKLKISGVESATFGMSLDIEQYNKMIGEELLKPTTLEQKLKMSLPASERYLSPVEYQKKMSIDPALEKQDLLEVIKKMKPVPSLTVVTMPSFGEKIRGRIRRVTGISIPGVAAVKEVIGVYAPKEIPGAAWGAAKEISEAIPAGVTLVAEKLGVPTIKEEIEIPEQRFFERGTAILKPTGELVLPEPKIIPGAPTMEITKISPEKIGRGLALGAYAIPWVGVGLLGTEVGKGVEVFRGKVPTVKQTILEQTSDLSIQERKEYLKTEEGKEYEKSVEEYIKSLEARRKAGLGMAALAGVAIAAPFAYRGIKAGVRYVKKPIPIYKAPRPKPISYYEAVTIPTKAEEAIGVAAVGELYPGRIGAIQPRWEKWLGKPTKFQFIEKPTLDVGVMPFKIVGKKEVGILVMQKVGPRTTMKTIDVITGKTIPAPKAIGEMPPLMQWIAKKGLPPRILPPGAEVTAEVGRIFRFGRISAKEARFFIPKLPIPLKKAPMQLGVTRAIRREIPGPIKLYDVESAIKSTKSLMPKKVGRVDYITGKVMVLPPKPSPMVVGEVIGRKLTKKQLLKQKQLVEQVGGLVARARIPKPKIPKIPKPIEVITPEAYVFAPTIVGGLGREVSRYYGKGLYEVTPAEIVRIPTVAITPEKLALVTKPTTVEIPLVYVKPKERIDFMQLGLSREKLEEKAITLEVIKEREELAVIPKLAPRIRLREAVIPKVVPREAVIPKLITEVIQKPKLKPFFPIPKPRPRPRPPKPKVVRRPPPPIILPPIKPPIKKIKKKKIEEELLFPFVRRYGKFIPVTAKPLPRRIAIKKGLARVRETLAAALQLRRPSGEMVPFAKVTKEFRVGRELTMVQVAPRRLARREEILEIIASRKAGAVKFA